jgi:hypothetical protein
MTSRRTVWMLLIAVLLLMLLDLLVFSSLRHVEVEPTPPPGRPTPATPQDVMPEAAWLDEQERAGWVAVGRFGGHWPARPVREHTDNDGIRFTRADGTPHHYSGFDGYRMRVVFLADASGRESIVVLRSRERLGPALPERD